METVPFFPFDEAKATQIAAHLIKKAGGVFDHYLLAKCFYDLDREALKKWGQPIVGGTYKLYDFGPLIYEEYKAASPGASTFFAYHIHRAGNQLSVARDPGDDELSQAEVKLAEQVFERWRNLTFQEAYNKSHALAECKNPKEDLKGDQIPVDLILRKAGKTPAQIREIAEEFKTAARMKASIESASLGSQTR